MHNTNGEGGTGRVRIKGRRVRIIEMRNIIKNQERIIEEIIEKEYHLEKLKLKTK
jgi:hypothetical protein